jgi:hypothetical protein
MYFSPHYWCALLWDLFSPSPLAVRRECISITQSAARAVTALPLARTALATGSQLSIEVCHSESE